MPSFSKAPRASRLRVKEHVHTFLESQVGPDGLRDCVTWARTASGEMIPTIGIPKVLEMLFNSWVVGVLRLEFGSAAVSLPSLEEEGQEEEDDEKEAESASVTV